jgi:hypothetical protein
MTYFKAPVLLLLATTPCRAACHTDHFNYYHGSEAAATMHVTSGSSCTIKLGVGGTSSIDSIAVTDRPKHGAASWNGSTVYPEVSYKSSPGYKGDDGFLFEISGPSQRSTSPAGVRVSVDVK